MTTILTLAVGGVYLGIALGHLTHGRVGLGLTFAAYAVANLGLVLAEREAR